MQIYIVMMSCHNVFFFFFAGLMYSEMAPNLFGNSAALFLEAAQQGIPEEKPSVSSPKPTYLEAQKSDKSKYTWQIVWRNVIAFVYLHVGALYGFYLFFTGAKILTVVWSKTIAFLINFHLNRIDRSSS